MRILKIQFKNLNSLAGEWAIDFTDPAYADNGIFAITGPTGAGKSTILDAISLGLYGRTPRLDRIGKGANEIMSRRTGECAAEVTFETQKGRYRCAWSQRRARKRPDGDLQPPSHEIADADTGRILESKMRDVLARVIEVTGMDYERFSRSMLLAQGGFAAFLQARPAERAPILEQITGTEIYSDISIAAHERAREEEAKLRELQAELAGLVLLEAGEEARLRGELAALAEREEALAASLREKNAAIAWLETMARLREELVEIVREEEDLRQRDAAFAPERERLALARRALDLAGEHAGLGAARGELERERERLDALRQRLPECDRIAAEAGAERERADGALRGKQAEQAAALALFRKVRTLDVIIQEKKPPLLQARARVENLAEEARRLGEERERDGAALKERRRELAEVDARLRASAGDERLVRGLAGLQGRFEYFQTLRGKMRRLEADCETARQAAADAETARRERAEEAERRRRGRDGERGALRELGERRDALLGSEDEARWRERLHDAERRRGTLAGIRAARAEAARLERRGAELKARLDSLDTALAASRAESDTLAGECAAQRETARLLEENHRLRLRVQSYEEARGDLRDGEPCPLCGALDHPFAGQAAPFPGDDPDRLAAARAELERTTARLHRLEVTRAGMERDRETVRGELKDLETSLAATRSALPGLCAEVGLADSDSSSGPDAEKTLAGLEAENDAALSRTDDVLRRAEALRLEMDARRTRLEQAERDFAEGEREALTAGHAAASAAREAERLEGAREDAARKFAAELDFLRRAAGEYGIDALGPETADAALDSLLARRDAWQDNERERLRLEREVETRDALLRALDRRLAEGETMLAEWRDAAAGLERELDAVAAERQALFAGRDVDAEEGALSGALGTLAAEAEKARARHDEAVGEQNSLRSLAAAVEGSLARREAEAEAAAAAFAARLGEKGFADEAAYAAARLPEGERDRLERESRALEAEAARLAALRRDKENLLRSEEEKAVTADSLAVLSAARDELNAQERLLQRDLGALSRVLADNDAARVRHGDRTRAAEARKRECERWQTLDRLIGSHDGGKYRAFAQGLTFDIMIHHANRQLRNMSDRYLLMRDPGEPLELQVVDGYQDDLPRSTRNLSGGESFLVSLALALGLSGMASRNVRVESLFLDEGFGSLDEDALDIALDTLSGLRNEGRLIGAISHVPALRERIGAHIEVTPLPGGVSRMDGPGCRRVDAAG